MAEMNLDDFVVEDAELQMENLSDDDIEDINFEVDISNKNNKNESFSIGANIDDDNESKDIDIMSEEDVDEFMEEFLSQNMKKKSKNELCLTYFTNKKNKKLINKKKNINKNKISIYNNYK